MLNQYELLAFAVKGVNADIEKLEKSVKHGKQLLKDYEETGTSKTSKTPYEVQQLIQMKKSEIEDLQEIEKELKWQLSELEA